MNSSHFLLTWERNPSAEACQYHAVPAALYRTTLCKLMVIYYEERLFYLEGFTHYSLFLLIWNPNFLKSLTTHKDYNSFKTYPGRWSIYWHEPVKTNQRGIFEKLFICTFQQLPKGEWLNQLLSQSRVRMRAACIWFHREVVNMPVFSTSLLFWHAQLRQSSSKVSAWGCGHCRSAFTHTNLHFSRFSPQYGWMLLPVSPCCSWWNADVL